MDLKTLKSKDLYTQYRYLMMLGKRIAAGSWIYFNGNQGQDYAIVYNQVANSYDVYPIA